MLRWFLSAFAAASLALVATACDGKSTSSTPRKPAGTPTDPVEICERVADVCRLDGAKLGVCVTKAPNSPSCPSAADGTAAKPCLVCQSQH